MAARFSLDMSTPFDFSKALGQAASDCGGSSRPLSSARGNAAGAMYSAKPSARPSEELRFQGVAATSPRRMRHVRKGMALRPIGMRGKGLVTTVTKKWLRSWLPLLSSVACTKYTVAPSDGGDGHLASGGGAGAMAGAGGAGGAGPKLDASPGLGGAAGSGTGTGGAGGMGGSAGSGVGVDASTKDALADVKDAVADLPLDTGGALLANGASCQIGNACQSGKCVDSFCCDSDCTGQCQSCGESSSPGKCVTISGTVRGQIRPTCTGSGTCAATCNGTDPAQCHFPGSEKPCASATCTAGVAKAAASCDGAGNCPPGATSSCDPFICGDHSLQDHLHHIGGLHRQQLLRGPELCRQERARRRLWRRRAMYDRHLRRAVLHGSVHVPATEPRTRVQQSRF